MRLVKRKQGHFSVSSYVFDEVQKFYEEYKDELLLDRVDSPTALVQAAVLEYIKVKQKEIAERKTMQKELKSK